MERLTREEAEAKIVEKLMEIKEIRDAYYPDDPYLTLCLNICNGKPYWSFNNAYWEHTNPDEGVLNANSIEGEPVPNEE